MEKGLYYGHDPMCSWCWAFNKTWADIQAQLPAIIDVRYVMGGLAPDSDQPMPEKLKEIISSGWYRIQERVPGTQFNHDYWTVAQPPRYTYPESSCHPGG